MAAHDNSNLHRANSALAAMTSSAKYSSGCEDSVTDLVTDLLHYARHQGIDTQAVLRKAQSNYIAELMGD